MRKNRKQRNIMIISLVAVLICMVVGYAAFSTKLNITGTSNITSSFDVKITDITSGSVVGNAQDLEAPRHTDTTANFRAGLSSPGDSITYDIKIENNGTLEDLKNEGILTENIYNNHILILISISVSALIAGLTIFFKSLMKEYALKNCNKIILRLVKILERFI